MLGASQPSPVPLVISDPAQVDAALYELGGGLTREILLFAVEEGERGRQNCTANHPVTAGGTEAYFQTVRALRDRLLPMGWTKECSGGSELTISPDGSIAIVVASGDENVGSLDISPRSKRAKGSRTARAARVNSMQMSFLDLLSSADAVAVATLQRENADLLTYILLFHRCDYKLSVELSLLVGLDDRLHVSEYTRRILIGDIELASMPLPSIDDGDEPVDVPVRLRV